MVSVPGLNLHYINLIFFNLYIFPIDDDGNLWSRALLNADDL